MIFECWNGWQQLGVNFYFCYLFYCFCTIGGMKCSIYSVKTGGNESRENVQCFFFHRFFLGEPQLVLIGKVLYIQYMND